MDVRNPWRKLKDEALKIRTPTLILRKQAELLDDATGGLIRGHVDTLERGQTTFVKFSACVPTLNNYQVSLFSVRQPVTQYPATLLTEWGDGKPVMCEDEAELEAAVFEYCESPELQKIVTGLFAQAHQAQG